MKRLKTGEIIFSKEQTKKIIAAKEILVEDFNEKKIGKILIACLMTYIDENVDLEDGDDDDDDDGDDDYQEF